MSITKDSGEYRDYVSYLLRMWQDCSDEGSPPLQEVLWRASLQSPHTGEQIGFADLDNLFAYLKAQTDDESRAEEDQRKEKNENGQQGHL
jgi:hypothetical protein